MASEMKRGGRGVSRRGFLRGVAAGAAAFTVVPRRVLAQAGQAAPSDKLNIASIGCAGMGGGDIENVKGENIVALCDVDWGYAAGTFQNFPQAKKYKDFRKMFDEMGKNIDAVTVSTPDHTHAVAAIAAIKRGKHVYCQKPLAHSIWEIRELMKAAREHKVVTQLGNQGHSDEAMRLTREWIADGAIGKVTEIHAFCSIDHCKISELPRRSEKHDVPATLDWDLWLGPAQFRSYHPMYLPGAWRGWMPFGSGTIGDWVCHVVDPSFWSLDLGAPTSVLAQADGYAPKEHADTFPHGTTVTYEFPARGDRGAVKLVWFDGNKRPPRPEELETGRNVPDIGEIIIGDKGKMMHGSHGAGGVRIIPEDKMKAYKQPAKTLPRVRAGHYNDWLDAIKEGRKAGSDFSYGGPLTEIAQLGIIATKMLGTKLEWDAANMKFPNCPDADQYLKPPFREGWSL